MNANLLSQQQGRSRSKPTTAVYQMPIVLIPPAASLALPTRSLATDVVLNVKSNRTLLAMVAHSKQLTNAPACQTGTPLQTAKHVRSSVRPKRRAVLMEPAILLLDTVSVKITTSRRIAPSC